MRLEVGTNTLPAPVVDMADAGDVPEELLVIVPVPVIAALTVIVQLAPAAAIAPVKVRVPEVAATVPAVPPAQMTLGTPKVMVPGPVTVSVKLLMLSALVLDALVIVMVSVDASLLYTVEGERCHAVGPVQGLTGSRPKRHKGVRACACGQDDGRGQGGGAHARAGKKCWSGTDADEQNTTH